MTEPGWHGSLPRAEDLVGERPRTRARTHTHAKTQTRTPALGHRRMAPGESHRQWVHSSVVRAADCRSAGPWFKSGRALLPVLSLTIAFVIEANVQQREFPRARCDSRRVASLLLRFSTELIGQRFPSLFRLSTHRCKPKYSRRGGARKCFCVRALPPCRTRAGICVPCACPPQVASPGSTANRGRMSDEKAYFFWAPDPTEGLFPTCFRYAR